MLQQFIQRHLRPPVDEAAVRAADAADKPASSFGNLRSADWLLGGSVVTLAIVFVAGLLGLRASTADLQDQARNNTRDLAALKADTVDRINGIAGDLAKTNQTLTDLLALRSGEPGARDAAGAADGRVGEGRGSATKGGEARGEGRPGTAPARIVPVPPVKPVAKAPKPAGRAEPVGLAPITVRRRPERERAARRPEPPARPAVAARPAPRTAAEASRARREAILRELRLRRLARRDF